MIQNQRRENDENLKNNAFGIREKEREREREREKQNDRRLQ